jgi:Peptidase MA superfamily
MRTPKGRLQVLGLLLLLLLGEVMPVGAQAEVSFGEPSASGAFGETLRFSTTFESTHEPLRVEMLSRVPGDDTLSVSIAAVEPSGPGAWRASVLQGGHVVPNTAFEYRFRVVTQAGSALGPTSVHRVDDERFEWQSLRGDGVTVWWYEGDEAFARRALDIAEQAVSSASSLLGVARLEPVDFIIYSDSRAFRQAMGPSTRENVGGQAHPDIRTLFGLIEPRQISSDWVEELVTHELTHLVFDAAVRNPYAYPPRWLNEGLAVYLSAGNQRGDKLQVEGAVRSGSIIPLDGLGGQFPTQPNRFALAYAESVAAVDYFVETYGQDRLVELITSFARGIGLDEAFVNATGDDFAAFDDAWLASLGAERPVPLGPVPA